MLSVAVLVSASLALLSSFRRAASRGQKSTSWHRSWNVYCPELLWKAAQPVAPFIVFRGRQNFTSMLYQKTFFADRQIAIDRWVQMCNSPALFILRRSCTRKHFCGSDRQITIDQWVQNRFEAAVCNFLYTAHLHYRVISRNLCWVQPGTFGAVPENIFLE